jgi:hypothetical protein
LHHERRFQSLSNFLDLIMSENIERRILRYLDDGFEDTDYIAEIVNSQSFSNLAQLICKLLKSSNEDTFSTTGLFLRDAILYGNRNEACHQFIAAYPESVIVKTLEELVFSDNYFIQSGAICTLGKTCSYSSKIVLSQAFDRFRDSHPLLLTTLLGEMGWLGVENLDNCIKQMADSSSYLTRWAAVQQIHLNDNKIPDWAEELRRDEYELIRLEAEYECQRILKRLQTSILSKIEQRQLAKTIKKIEPEISFFGACLRFSHHLVSNGLSQYTVADFEAYVDSLE